MPTSTETPLDRATAESADALSTMEAEAAEFFATQDAAKAAPLNPVAPALERAASAKTPSPSPGKKAAAASPGSKQAVAPAATGKATPAAPASARVPGAPSLPTPTAAPPGTADTGEAVASAASPPAAREGEPSAPDISDLPTDYTPGKLRAPHWEKLRANRDHYEALAVQRHQEAEELRAALEAERAKAAGTPSEEASARLAALQAERDAFKAQLQAVAGERLFDVDSRPRREAAIAQAKAAAGSEAARIEQLLALPESSYRDEQIESLLAALPPLRATKLTQAVADLDRLTLERASAAAQGGELWQRRVADEAARAERARAENTQRAVATFDTEVKEWERAGVTPDEIEMARSVYTGKGASLEDASRAALWGAVGPRVAAQLTEVVKRNAELESELAKLRGAQPGVGAGGSGALPTANDDDDDPSITSMADRVAKMALRSGVRFGAQ